MELVLPAGIPTLCAKNTKNYTRPDNVFTSAGIAKRVIKCGMRPEERPICMDHMPIVGAFDLKVVANATANKRNFHNVDWKKFWKELNKELQNASVPERIVNKDILTKKVEELEVALQRVVEKEVPVAKITPYSKR